MDETNYVVTYCNEISKAKQIIIVFTARLVDFD